MIYYLIMVDKLMHCNLTNFGDCLPMNMLYLLFMDRGS